LAIAALRQQGSKAIPLLKNMGASDHPKVIGSVQHLEYSALPEALNKITKAKQKKIAVMYRKNQNYRIF
jgi:hypothetical protein